MTVTEPSITTGPEAKVARLNTASIRRVIEPEETFDWSSLRPGQVLPDELLSVAGLDLDLTPEQRARLSREEAASMLSVGVAFEAVLMAGFSLQIARSEDLTDPRVAYMLHEVGEETRHSRAFIRLIDALGPTATNPLRGGIPLFVMRRVVNRIIQAPALLCVMILGGEEIPDLMQKLASEHPDTDPLVAEVNRYHRMEEARHLAFARLTLAELYAEAGFLERQAIRFFAPSFIQMLFQTFVHPGVYATVGLPAMATWKAANATPERIGMRHAATRPILEALLAAGVVSPGRIPRPWRRLCGVDQEGRPQT
jgi:hypothetical protein